MKEFFDLFHTKISSALSDASTWPSLAAVIGGAVSVPPPYSYGVIICGIIGVFMKSNNTENKP